MVCSWGFILFGLATVYWFDGKPSFGLFLAIWGANRLRRQIPTAPVPNPRWAPFALMAVLIIAVALIFLLSEELSRFIFISALGLLFLYTAITDLKQFRSPLRFFPPEDLARLKTAE